MNLSPFITILAILSLFFNNSCNSQITNNKNMKQQERAHQLIEEQYGKSFVIHDCKLQTDGLHHLSASPADNAEITFNFTYNEETDNIFSYYTVQLWGYDASNILKKKLQPNYEDRFVGKVDIINSQETGIDDKNLPSYSELVDQYPEAQKIHNYIYIFKDVNNDNKEEMLKGLIEYIDYYQQKKTANTIYEVSFFDEASFAGKDLSEYQFGFNKISDESFEMEEADEYFKGKFMFEMKADSPTPNAEQLFETYDTFIYSQKYTKF